MSYQTFINDMPVYTNATPNQTGIISPYNGKLSIVTSQQPILENEFQGIFISHIIRPTAIIATDNKAAMYLFRKDRFPAMSNCSSIIDMLSSLPRYLINLIMIKFIHYQGHTRIIIVNAPLYDPL